MVSGFNVFHLAQLNIAEFRKPPEHGANREFFDNLDLVNALAERSRGFVWRLVDDDGENATDIRPFANPNMIVNLSVWDTVDSLAAFVYRNKSHRQVMRKRTKWFKEMDFYLVLWWIKEGHTPSLDEAQERLALLKSKGPGPMAFTFKNPYPPSSNV